MLDFLGQIDGTSAPTPGWAHVLAAPLVVLILALMRGGRRGG